MTEKQWTTADVEALTRVLRDCAEWHDESLPALARAVIEAGWRAPEEAK